MKKINITLFSLLKGTLSKANIQIFLTLIESFLRNKGKITVRSLSRYCGEYSLRQLFRFFGIVHNWIEISIVVFKEGLYQQGKKYLIAIDETVIEKSGRHTHGKHRFYSSVYEQVVSGIGFMALSLIDVEKRKSYSISQEQIIVNQADKVKLRKKQEKKRSSTGEDKSKKRGRPKGRQNEVKTEPDTPAYRAFKILLEKVFGILIQIIPQLQVRYAVLDSAYAVAGYIRTLQQYGLAVISKLSSDAVLYLPAKPSPTKYGQKIKLADIDDPYLVQTIQKNTHTEYIYQITGYQKSSLKNYYKNFVSCSFSLRIVIKIYLATTRKLFFIPRYSHHYTPRYHS